MLSHMVQYDGPAQAHDPKGGAAGWWKRSRYTRGEEQQETQ